MKTAAEQNGAGLCLESQLPLGLLCPRPGTSVCSQQMHSDGSSYPDCVLQGSGCGTPVDMAACSSGSLEESGRSTFLHPDQDQSALPLLGLGHDDDPGLLFDSPYSAAEFLDPQVGSLQDLLDLEDTQCSTLPAGRLLPPPAFTIIAQEQRLEAAWLLAQQQDTQQQQHRRQQFSQQQQKEPPLLRWVPAAPSSHPASGADQAPMATNRRAATAAGSRTGLIAPGTTRITAGGGHQAAVLSGRSPGATQQQQQQAVLVPLGAAPAAGCTPAVGVLAPGLPPTARRGSSTRSTRRSASRQAARALAGGSQALLALDRTAAPAPAAAAPAAAQPPARPGLDLSLFPEDLPGAGPVQGTRVLARGRAVKRSWDKYRTGTTDTSSSTSMTQQQQQGGVLPRACMAPATPATCSGAAAAAAVALAAAAAAVAVAATAVALPQPQMAATTAAVLPQQPHGVATAAVAAAGSGVLSGLEGALGKVLLSLQQDAAAGAATPAAAAAAAAAPGVQPVASGGWGKPPPPRPPPAQVNAPATRPLHTDGTVASAAPPAAADAGAAVGSSPAPVLPGRSTAAPTAATAAAPTAAAAAAPTAAAAAAAVAASGGQLRLPHVPPALVALEQPAPPPVPVVRLELEGRKVEVWLTPGMDAAAFERRVREALELESDEELDMMFEVPRPQGGSIPLGGLDTFDKAAQLAAENAAMRAGQPPQKKRPAQTPQQRLRQQQQQQKRQQQLAQALLEGPPWQHHVPPSGPEQAGLLMPQEQQPTASKRQQPSVSESQQPTASKSQQPPRKRSRLANASPPSPLPPLPRPAFPPSLPLFVQP